MNISGSEATGKAADDYRAKRAEYDRKVTAAPPVMEIVKELWAYFSFTTSTTRTICG